MARQRGRMVDCRIWKLREGTAPPPLAPLNIRACAADSSVAGGWCMTFNGSVVRGGVVRANGIGPLRTEGHRVPDAAVRQLNGLLKRVLGAVLGSGLRLRPVDKAVDRAVDIAVDNFVD